MAIPPVLLITWNRADTTARVLQEILKANPVRLYVSADGPREGNESDRRGCNDVKKLIRSLPNSQSVRERFSATNSGARTAILGGIDWFFDNEVEGIILEDDSLPSPEFFSFATNNLDRFRSDSTVCQISGTNYLKDQVGLFGGFFRSRHMHIWGFATWRSRWELYRKIQKTAPEEIKKLAKTFPNESRRARKEWSKRFIHEMLHYDDNWDSGWNFCGKLNGLSSITPTKCLVQNIGFDERGLHANRLPLISGFPPPVTTETFQNAGIEVDERTATHLDRYTERVQWAIHPVPIKILLGAVELIRRLQFAWQLKPAPNPQKYRTAAEIFWGAWLREMVRIVAPKEL